MATENHYQTLRVSFDADAEAIKRAYRKIAQIYHPDKRENKKFAEHKIKIINEACSVLSDAQKRAQYDADNGIKNENRDHSKGVYVEGIGDTADVACYRNEERHGEWDMHYQDGQVETGRFVDGEKHGKWEIRFPDGDVHIGEYADGKRHGFWMEKSADGGVGSGEYVNGERHGEWIVRSAEGHVFKGFYVDGEKHGAWEETLADGSTQFRRYDMGEEKEAWKVSPAPESEDTASEDHGDFSYEIWWWLVFVVFGFGMGTILYA